MLEISIIWDLDILVVLYAVRDSLTVRVQSPGNDNIVSLLERGVSRIEEMWFVGKGYLMFAVVDKHLTHAQVVYSCNRV
jgi:hypothetical protein